MNKINSDNRNRVNMQPQGEIEDKLLGMLILAGLKISDDPMPYYDMLLAGNFINPRNSEIFKALRFMYNEADIGKDKIEIDLVNLRDELIMRDVQDMFGGIEKMVEYLCVLVENVADYSEVMEYTYEILKRDSRRLDMRGVNVWSEREKANE